LNENTLFWVETILLINFYLIYRQDTLEINVGIQMSIEFQKALKDEAIYLIERRAISTTSQFRMVTIKNDTPLEKKYFTHPINL
jgi:hypothetical protein